MRTASMASVMDPIWFTFNKRAYKKEKKYRIQLVNNLILDNQKSGQAIPLMFQKYFGYTHHGV